MLPTGATFMLATWVIIAVISGISRQTARIFQAAIDSPITLNRSTVAQTDQGHQSLPSR